jgi:hypothetical protein
MSTTAVKLSKNIRPSHHQRAVETWPAPRGWPGQIDLYRVDFRVPPGTVSGMATLQLRVLGITGPAGRSPVLEWLPPRGAATA